MYWLVKLVYVLTDEIGIYNDWWNWYMYWLVKLLYVLTGGIGMCLVKEKGLNVLLDLEADKTFLHSPIGMFCSNMIKL